MGIYSIESKLVTVRMKSEYPAKKNSSPIIFLVNRIETFCAFRETERTIPAPNGYSYRVGFLAPKSVMAVTGYFLQAVDRITIGGGAVI